MAEIKGMSPFLITNTWKKMTLIEDMSSCLYPKEKNMTVMKEITFTYPNKENHDCNKRFFDISF